MEIAEQTAKLSYAEKLKVGAVLVKENRIISIGYNGTAPGTSNICEYKIESSGGTGEFELKTKDEVLHAEENLIAKIAQSTESSVGSIMFITHAPCFRCSRLIFACGINKIFYRNEYRNMNGVYYLRNMNALVEQI